MNESFNIEEFAHLARLDLSEKEKTMLQKDIENILAMVGKLSEVDLSVVEENINNRIAPNYMRDDLVEEKFTVEEVCSTMPELEENSLKVPQIIEE